MKNHSSTDKASKAAPPETAKKQPAAPKPSRSNAVREDDATGHDPLSPKGTVEQHSHIGPQGQQ